MTGPRFYAQGLDGRPLGATPEPCDQATPTPTLTAWPETDTHRAIASIVKEVDRRYVAARNLATAHGVGMTVTYDLVPVTHNGYTITFRLDPEVPLGEVRVEHHNNSESTNTKRGNP